MVLFKSIEKGIVLQGRYCRFIRDQFLGNINIYALIGPVKLYAAISEQHVPSAVTEVGNIGWRHAWQSISIGARILKKIEREQFVRLQLAGHLITAIIIVAWEARVDYSWIELIARSDVTRGIGPQ